MMIYSKRFHVENAFAAARENTFSFVKIFRFAKR